MSVAPLGALQVRRAVKLEKIKRWDTSAVNFSYAKTPCFSAFLAKPYFFKTANFLTKSRYLEMPPFKYFKYLLD
jgi:hypothetical protein